MTYPQQPGQPYGQQPGWQQPGPPQPGPPQRPGGYPQQGQFPPGMGQQYPGPGQYGQQPMGGGMGPGPQPPKRKTGLAVGIVVAVVVALAAFAVTAFVAPGFLLSEDKDSGGTTASSNDSGEGDDSNGGVDAGDSEAATLVEQIVQGFVDKDEDALNELVCSGSEPAIRGYTEEVEFVKEFELLGPVEESGETATAQVHAVLENGEEKVEAEATITVADEGSGWCWKDMSDE